MHSPDTFHYSLAVLGSVLFFWCTFIIQRKWTRGRFAQEKHCQPPVLAVSKFFGLDTIRQTIAAANKHRVLELSLSRFKTYGNTYSVNRLATTVITTREPQNIKTILSLRFRDYGLGNRIRSFGPLLGYGIFTTDGEHWARSRAMIRPNFVKDRIADLDIFEELMGDLVKLIPTDGSTVDLQDLFFCYTIDSATEFLFGHSVQVLKKHRYNVGDESVQDFASAFNYAQHAIATHARMGPLRNFYRDHKAKDANRICHELVEEFVGKALRYREGFDEKDVSDRNGKDDKPKYLFLQGLAQQTGDWRRIRDELMNVLLAGRDTTASLLSNMFFMLAKNPEIWAKLRAEIATLEGHAPKYEQLRSFTYLKYCINECKLFLYDMYCLHLLTFSSTPYPSSRPQQCSGRRCRHHTACWRWPRRSIPSFCAQGYGCYI